jgi:GNAT superfamily N-acetyltransferase
LSAVGVREAVSDDVARLASWNAQLIADEGNDAPMAVDELVMRMREWLASEYRACVFDADGTPCGYALFRDLPECTHVRHFFVEAAHRRRGVGRRAFEALRRTWFAPDKRVLVEVLVWNDRGTAFWKRIGFEERYLGLQLTTDVQGQRND